MAEGNIQLRRKIEKPIRDYLTSDQNRILIVEGARQVGKSYTIREIGSRLFPNFIEVNLAADKEGERLFESVKSVDDFYLRISISFGDRIGNREDTLIFLDEIQIYPRMLTLLKFLNQEGRFRYIVSGSLLGITLRQAVSIPVGSVRILEMYPLDFEEFLWANNVGDFAIQNLKTTIAHGSSPDATIHDRLLSLWRYYLIVGGLPAAVREFMESRNFYEVRSIQNDIIRLYKADASQYAEAHKLLINRIYDMIPSMMENKKKRIVAKNVEDKKGARFASYREEFEYLISSGIALETAAVSNPRFPLAESVTKNLLKLYLNDAGLLTALLYGSAIQAVLDDSLSINLGSLYETAVAVQLKCSGHKLFYYDNKKKGEVDFLINDFARQTVMPIEVKSGKDYTIHSAISRLLEDREYGISEGVVLSNSGTVRVDDNVRYLPVYFSTFL